jgi:glycosyltransferase involved in cell wall biosynthesis
VSAESAGPVRVALLNPCFYPEVQRGSERLIRDLATDLIAAGHRPRLITSHPGPPSRTVEDGLPVLRNWRPPEARLARRGFQEYLTQMPFSFTALRAGDDDLAQAFFPTDAVAAIRWARRTGRPAVFHYGGIPTRPVLASRRLRLRLLREALYEADAVVVDSQAAASGMRRWFGRDPRVINPGVRLDAFRPGGERFDRPTIACAAQPDDARKRVPLLLDAFRLVRRSRRDARLMLPRPASVSLAGSLERVDGVELFEPGPDAVAPIFQRAWVTALAAYNEAFGLVLVESLACGTPVVAARDGAVPEIVDRPEVGRLFEGGADSLAQALLEGLDLAGDSSTAGACRTRAEDFPAARCAAEHVALYRELLASRSGLIGRAGVPPISQPPG